MIESLVIEQWPLEIIQKCLILKRAPTATGVIVTINNLHPPVAAAAPERKETNQWTPVTSVAPVIRPQTHPVTSVAPDPDKFSRIVNKTIQTPAT